jgi:hypothetical protein
MPLSPTSEKVQVSIYMDAHIKEALTKLAKRQRRSLSNLVEVLCEQEVEKEGLLAKERAHGDF